PVKDRNRASRSMKVYDSKVFETEAAMKMYMSQHHNAPVKTLSEILLTGKVVPSRALTLMSVVGRSIDEAGYLQHLLTREELRQDVLKAMADQRLDALVYATFDQPPARIPSDATT